MDYKDDFLKEFLINKTLSHSSSYSGEKVEAIRKQCIILHQISESSSESDRVSLYRSQFKEYNLSNDNSYNAFLVARTKGVLKLLGDLPRSTSTVSLSAKDFLNKNKISLERECSGIYKSCNQEEIKAEDLTFFNNVLGVGPYSQAQQGVSPPRKLAQQRTTFGILKKDNVVASPRQESISAFLTKVTPNNSLQATSFRTAREELIVQNLKRNGDSCSSSSNTRTLFNYGASKKSLGARRNVRSGFVPPIRQDDNSSPTRTPPDAIDVSSTEPIDERLRNVDPKMVELISNEIMHKYKNIGWDDIAGLDYAKSTIQEAVVWPLLRPDIFTGLRRPPRGILLFGPPGTGKTLIGKCIASQSKSTFFSISASSLTSKWVGDGEKMVRALFAVAAVHQPSVVFIDEIDSLLSQRSETEHDSSRRLKTEFLVQLDGANTTEEERILIVAATNRPQELDEAARRRLVRRLYIPLPEISARVQILTNLLQTVQNILNEDEIFEIGNQTEGYSGADMETLCREASMEPIRSIPPDEIASFSAENVRPVELKDFYSALLRVRASVSSEDLQQYANWNIQYGAGGQ